VAAKKPQVRTKAYKMEAMNDKPKQNPSKIEPEEERIGGWMVSKRRKTNEICQDK
jgi:hypothetical protein